MILAISPVASNREGVFATTHSAVALERKASLPDWMVLITMLLRRRFLLRSLDSRMAGTKVTVELGETRRNANVFCSERASGILHG